MSSSIVKIRPTILAQLNITAEQVSLLPQVTPYLTHIMSGLKSRNLVDDPWYYLEACGDIDSSKIKAIRNSLSKQSRRWIPLEAFCAAAGVDPNSILSSIVAAVDRLHRYSATVKVSSAQTDVTDKMIERSLADDGFEDRQMFMKISGLMPAPKGAQTNIQVVQNATATSTPVTVIAPPPESTIRRLSERLNAARALTQEAIVVSATEDE